MTYVVIMAGGSGERFWPVSRLTKPKQLLKLTHPTMTMLEQAVERIERLVPVENILVITSSVLQQPITDSMPALPPQNVIAEPAKRNTAPCLALAAVEIRKRTDEDSVMAVLTADHFIGDPLRFGKDVEECIQFARTHDALVTMGVRPTRPETGYGYIEVDEAQEGIVPVRSFKEKPNPATALDYVRSGRYLWNSGMFFWRVSTFEKALAEHLPEVGQFCSAPGDVATSFARLPDISIDYGVMERASNVHVKQAAFPWDDVGSWDALARLRGADDAENVVNGPTVLVDSQRNVVVNATTTDHVVTGVGLKDHIVIVTDDATMIAPKSRAQDVKNIVKALRDKGRDNVL
jgi:mannose-1-phosphate guanylyltransferase